MRAQGQEADRAWGAGRNSSQDEAAFPGGILEPMTICGYYWQKIIADPLRATTEAQRTHRDFL